MRKNIFLIIILLVFVAIITYSCTKQEVVKNEIFTKNKSNTIRPEVALADLKSFLQDNYTKNFESLSVKDIECLTLKKIKTKFDNTESCLPDTLLYFVNFDEDNGYAILAADNRISATILAVTEQGELHPDDFLNSINSDTTNNLSDFYCVEEGDFYYFVSSDDLRIENQLIYDYTVKEIESAGEGNDNNEPTNEGLVHQDGSASGGSGGGLNYHYEWRTTESIPAMLTTKWAQGYPYSAKCPLFNYNAYGKGVSAGPAGCGAIAAAQVINYFKWPQNFTFNNCRLLFEEYKDKYSNNKDNVSIEDETKIASFILSIAIGCGTEFSHKSAKTTIKRVKNCLNTLGYPNLDIHHLYSTHGIVNMVKNGNPVIIGANKAWKRVGHLWVIDGYRKQALTSMGTGNVIKERILLHCNWGWGGNNNGYFASKIFDVGNPVEFDPIDTQDLLDASDRYKWFYQYLSYDSFTN